MKNIFLILIFLIGLNFTSFAQNGSSSSKGNSQTKFIKIYPNPASSVVNFEFQRDYSRSFSIRVLNSIGKQVYESKNIPPLLTLNVKEEKFYRGIYIYQLLDKNGIVLESVKFMVVN